MKVENIHYLRIKQRNLRQTILLSILILY